MQVRKAVVRVGRTAAGPEAGTAVGMDVRSNHNMTAGTCFVLPVDRPVTDTVEVEAAFEPAVAQNVMVGTAGQATVHTPEPVNSHFEECGDRRRCSEPVHRLGPYPAETDVGRW